MVTLYLKFATKPSTLLCPAMWKGFSKKND